jgi:hypothetical protein
MKTKNIIAALATLGLALTLATPIQAGSITHWQMHQCDRIYEGAVCGRLTRGETRAFVHEQRQINSFKQYAWSDGILMPWERGRINIMQGCSSDHIYRFKHNRWHR